MKDTGHSLNMFPCIENALGDELGLATGNIFENVINFLCGIKVVDVYGGFLTACSIPAAATVFLFHLFFGCVHNFINFAVRKPKEGKGGGLCPLVPCLENSDFPADSYFPNSQRNGYFHCFFGFSFFLLLQVFGLPCLSL